MVVVIFSFFCFVDSLFALRIPILKMQFRKIYVRFDTIPIYRTAQTLKFYRSMLKKSFTNTCKIEQQRNFKIHLLKICCRLVFCAACAFRKYTIFNIFNNSTMNVRFLFLFIATFHSHHKMFDFLS